MKRQCEEATKNFETGPRNEVEILLCHCLSFRFAHKPSEHKRLMSDYDWRAWDQRRNMQVYEDHVR